MCHVTREWVARNIPRRILEQVELNFETESNARNDA